MVEKPTRRLTLLFTQRTALLPDVDSLLKRASSDVVYARADEETALVVGLTLPR